MEFSSGLRAAVDRVIPQDDRPGGWAGGVAAYVAASPDLGWAADALLRLDKRLEELAAGRSFVDLAPEHQDELLNILASGPQGAADFAALRRIAFEGYYAAREGASPAGLDLVGFRAVPEGVEPVESDLVPDVGIGGVRRDYDAIIIGSGPGGGVAAQLLAQAGRRVLVIERALRSPNAALRGDHLRGKRNAVYRPTAGPGGRSPARRTAPRRRPRSRRGRRRFALRLERERDGWWHETVAGHGLAIPAGGLPDGLGLRQP